MKDKRWKPDRINVEVAHDILNRINAADPEQPNHRETVIQGKVKHLKKDVKYKSILMDMDWDALKKYVDTLEDNAILLVFLEALHDELMIDRLKADNAERDEIIRKKVKVNVS